MDYRRFAKMVESKFRGFSKVLETGAQIIVHRKGETAEDEQGRNFIINTNIKHYGKESEKLLGDFVEIIINSGNTSSEFIRINLSNAFGVFSNHDDSWSSVEEMVADQISYAIGIRKNAMDIIGNLEDYDAIKSKLIIRPINYDNNEYSLKGCAYEKVGDIALVLYALVSDDGECTNTIRIPAEVMNKWNDDWHDIFNDALVNTYLNAMPRLYTNLFGIETAPDSETAFMTDDCTVKELAANSIPLLTTTKKVNGAIAIFYKGVAEKIAEMFGDSFYVAFTSIHECMLHKVGSVEPDSIRRHIKATNNTFGPEETLTNEVFFYNKDTEEFTVV